MAKSYYDILNISPNATPEEIKKAYRESARKGHPDLFTGKQEYPERLEQFKELNEAYEVLGDTKKRRKYDQEEGVKKEAEGQSREHSAMNKSKKAPTHNPFDSIFDELMFSGNNTVFGSRPKQEDYITIPEADWGLLVALKQAYESKADGKWRVLKPESDTRDWMPEVVYTVRREGADVSIFRVITDWRHEFNRSDPIGVKKDPASRETDIEYLPNALLGEYFLYEPGKRRLSGSNIISGQLPIYLNALKSLASKFAKKKIGVDGKYDVGNELQIMNNYSQYHAPNIKFEGRSLYTNEKDRELVRKIRSKDFWSKFHAAEGLVAQVEGASITKERGWNQSPEG